MSKLMLCEKCRHIVACQAFSTGKCKICGVDVVTPHIPAYCICEECAEKLQLCQQCGKVIG